MTICVIDASAVGPLIFNDEMDAIADGIGSVLAEHECHAPQYWPIEVANVALSGARRNRLDYEAAERSLITVATLAIAIDPMTTARLSKSWALATTHKLTIYDAGYLELALRLGATLVSHDKELRQAAGAEGLEILPP